MRFLSVMKGRVRSHVSPVHSTGHIGILTVALMDQFQNTLLLKSYIFYKNHGSSVFRFHTVHTTDYCSLHSAIQLPFKALHNVMLILV